MDGEINQHLVLGKSLTIHANKTGKLLSYPFQAAAIAKLHQNGKTENGCEGGARKRTAPAVPSCHDDG